MSTLSIPDGVPADHIWLPVVSRENALRALELLYRAQQSAPSSHNTDNDAESRMHSQNVKS